jgi:CRP-like cAMP-binding protein
LDLFCNQEVAEKIFPFFNIFSYEPGHIIQQEGEQSLNIYWIINGECSVDRVVPFVSNPKKLGKQVRRYIPAEILQDGDQLVNLKLTTQKLLADSCFPTIPFLGTNSDTLRYLGADALVKDNYIDFYSRLSASDHRTWLPCTVRASTTVVIGSMHMIDFIRLVPKEMIFQLALKPSIHDFGMKELQEQYLEEQRWGVVKKEIMNDVINNI